jgi:DNA-binding ferritin-like protein
MVRRTYYYPRDVADQLAEAVDRLHYDSRGRITKHEALAAIIAAGLEQFDTVAERLSHVSYPSET